MSRAVEAVARLLTRIAAVFLLAMVLVNVVDVGLRGLFNIPVFGSFDLIELCMAFVAFLVIPETFLRNEHITIELIDSVLPPGAVRALKLFGLAATVVFVVVLSYFMVEPAVDFWRFNETTIELQIPAVWKAAPVLAGFVIAIFAVIVMFVRELRAPGSVAASPAKDPV
jgi:TRAP-type C4-dicarboxylate transport system permease small subunit